MSISKKRIKRMDEKPKLKIKDTTVYTKDLKIALERCSEVPAAYLFGSAAGRGTVVNDLDILVLLHQGVDKDEAYINLTHNLSKSLKFLNPLSICCFLILKKQIPQSWPGL